VTAACDVVVIDSDGGGRWLWATRLAQEVGHPDSTSAFVANSDDAPRTHALHF